MNKELLKKLEEQITNIPVSYDYEQTYCDLYNAVIDYQNETQTWDFEYLFEDYANYYTVEEIAKSIIDKDGLLRLYYFMGDANFNNNLFMVDGYGNLTNVTKENLEDLKEQILDIIYNKLVEEEQ